MLTDYESTVNLKVQIWIRISGKYLGSGSDQIIRIRIRNTLYWASNEHDRTVPENIVTLSL